MNLKALKKLLVGVLTVTTVFSTLGSSVVSAGEDDGISQAIIYVDETFSTGSDNEPGVVDAQVEQNNDSNNGASDVAQAADSTDSADSADSVSNDQAVIDASTGDVPEAVTDAATGLSEAAGTDASTNPAEAAAIGSSGDDSSAVSASTDAADAASSDASTEGEASATDASAAASSGASLDDEALASALGASIAQNKTLLEGPSDTGIKNELENPEFGEVTDLVLPDSIDDWNEEFTLKFSFKVYNAETIPDGKFTYRLPDKLDFSAIAGTSIMVKGEGGAQIGTAEVGSDNVITFAIDQNYLELKPNGIRGSVELNCKIDTSKGGEDDTIKIIFSDENSIEIKIKDSVITAKKDPITLSNGQGTFYVNFDVNTDTTNFVITDTLGEDLEFVPGARWFMNTSDYSTPKGITYELVDSRTLKVTIPSITRGNYQLGYQVTAVEGAASTNGKTAEELIEGSTRNTAQWTWDGSKNDHIVKSYALIPSHNWIKKNGTNGQKNGMITADGYCNWIVFINSGGAPCDVKGMTLTDTLSAGMVFCQEGMSINKSYDGKTWKVAYPLTSANFGKNSAGLDTLTFTFPNDAEAAFYSISYKSKIDGTLPVNKTTYSNTATISLGNEVYGTDTAQNTYYHVGAFVATVDKEVNDAKKPRKTDTGIVEWKSAFYVQGDNNNFTIDFKDVIAPVDGAKIVNGKAVAADILADSVKLYHADENGDPTGTPLNATVTYNGNSFTARITGVKSGRYVIIYSTQDYYGDKSNHSFPEGFTINFINKISMTIDSQTVEDTASYEVKSNGLPMLKEALPGYYDSSAKTFAIPWKVYINRNTLGQTNESIADGDKTVITDYLPKELSYKQGSAVVTGNDGTTFNLDPVETKAADGTSKLTWNFNWKKAASVTASSNYYVIDFVTYVDKEFFDKLQEQDGDGTVHLSFQNNVVGDIGDNKGSANTSSEDEITFLAKKAEINSKTQYVEYTITVNKEGFDLLENSDVVRLTDDLTNGAFVAGSLKVYNYGTNTEYTLPASDIETAANGRKFTITLPDEKGFVVKYSVKPDPKQGEKISDTQTQVNVSNKATLYGNGSKSSEWNKKYTVDTVSADITSDKGSVTITKVDSKNLLKGLDGAVIALYRTDIKTGKETFVSSKTTVANDFSVTFSTDGKYDSLIFDTLYYYVETKAPEGYDIDDSKYYFIFKGTKYNIVKSSVEKYIADQGVKSDHYVVLDPKDLLGGNYDVKLQNEKTDSASIKVTKVDSADTSKGLAGAEISLYRTDISTGKETKVASKVTAADDYSVTFNSDGAYDSLYLNTLYYYSETKAPDGYEADTGKYYFIFKGQKYDKIKKSVEQYIADQGIKSDHFVVLDPKQLPEGRYGAKLLNEKIDIALITVKKVDSADTSKGLAGAEITLFRTNVSTGAETKVAAKTTSAIDYSVTFSSDVASDSLLLDTLYYYSETKAPEGYELDSSKYYFIFKGKQYDSVKNSVEKYIADQGVKSDHFVVLDPKTLSEGKYGATLLNIEKTDKVLITVTKVDSADRSKGLAGAEITLFRTNVSTGVETRVASGTTAANDYSVTFSADVASDSLLLDTLYYYSETKAPEGYELDSSKYYFIFKGKKYDSVKNSVEKYIADQGVNSDHYVVLNPKELYQGRFGVMLLNKSKPGEPPENPPSPPDEPPSPPDNPPTTPQEPPTLTPAEEVLGARRPEPTPAPQPAVLGARRSRTGDSDMRFAYMGLLGAMAGLVLLTRKRKDQKNKDNA